MKKIISWICVILLPVFTCYAQQQYSITVNSAGKPVIAGISADNKINGNFILVFDSSFRNKEIGFYHQMNDADTLIRGVFDTDIAKDGSSNTYRILVGGNEIIFDDRKKPAMDTFYIRIAGGGFSLPVYIAGQTNIEVKSSSGSAKHTPGFVVYDALLLNNESTDIATVRKILQHYGITDDDLDGNVFLNDVLTAPFTVNNAHKGSHIQSGLSSLISTAGSAIGGMDVTNIADGFAKFIVKRTKEELSIAFFQKFKERLETYKDLKTVFPGTYKLLIAIDDQIYNYSSYINNLRETFRSDLLAIDDNLPSIVENHPDFFNTQRNAKYGLALKSACYISTSLRDDMHPGDILQAYKMAAIDSALQYDRSLYPFRGAIQALQLFSHSLREGDTSKHSYWVSIDKVRQLVDNKDALKIYFGLVLQEAVLKYDSVRFNSTDNLYKTMNTSTVVKAFDTTYTQYKEYILTLGSKVNELNKMITEYEKIANDSARVEQYARYFKNSVKFIEYCVQATQLPYVKDITGVNELPQKTKVYFDVCYEAADLTSSIVRKRYPEVVNHVVAIYNSIVNQPALESIPAATLSKELTKKEKIALADRVISEHLSNPSQTTATALGGMPELRASVKEKPAKSKDFDREQKLVLAETLVRINSSDPNKKLSDAVIIAQGVKAPTTDADPTPHKAGEVLASIAKYGAFMSNMIEAESSEEVAEVIEAAVLPAGSARIKRTTRTNVAINAYCGLFAGNEVIRGLDADKPFSRINSFGLTAPIGFTFSKGDRLLPWPLSQLFKLKGVSSSWFVSLVDLGAVAAFRFSDNTTEEVPTIQLKDIFSPGLFWSVGIPKSPISVNMGAQVGPNLRRVNVAAGANDYSNGVYVRYSASICVDLPLLNLYTKGRE